MVTTQGNHKGLPLRMNIFKTLGYEYCRTYALTNLKKIFIKNHI
jgi:hypothetical protein